MLAITGVDYWLVPIIGLTLQTMYAPLPFVAIQLQSSYMIAIANYVAAINFDNQV